MMITGKQNIELFRHMTLRQGLKLEISGLKVSRGVSILKILKKEGYTGTRAQVLAQLDEIHAQIHKTDDDYEARVTALENEGLTRSDAQAVVDAQNN